MERPVIILGCYPQTFRDSNQIPLQVLLAEVNKTIPDEVGLHILPFFPSSGDSGFAPDNWFTVDKKYGTWNDIKNTAISRKLIVDGIYNHVGIKHQIARKFFSDPENYSQYVYAFKDTTKIKAPLSPRGGSVLNQTYIYGKPWLIWQTFPKFAIDINLDNPEILDYIEKQMIFFKETGIWGLRLDGPAHYGKDLNGTSLRHMPSSFRIARTIAKMAVSCGLNVSAQLDCDQDGSKYFPHHLGFQIPIVDFSYSALLLYTFLSQDVGEFIEHIKLTWDESLIRAPRNHDGILLRSRNLSTSVKRWLFENLNDSNVNLRIIDNDPYEYNNSLPYLFSLGESDDIVVMHKIYLSIALSTIIPGWSYIYLPFLAKYIPENECPFEEDPRLVNRNPMSYNYWRFIADKYGSSIYSLLKSLSNIKNRLAPCGHLKEDSIYSPQNGVVVVHREDNNGVISFIGNLNSSVSVSISKLVSGDLLLGQQVSQTKLLPFGFGFFKK